MKKLLAIALVLWVSAALSAESAPLVIPVSATVVFSDGTPFEGRVILYDTTAGTTGKSWTLAGGAVSDTVSLDPSHAYRVDLIGGSGNVRESVTIFAAFLPTLASASFKTVLSRNFEGDGKTYIVQELQADLKF
jgi:hypothetical protein